MSVKLIYLAILKFERTSIPLGFFDKKEDADEFLKKNDRIFQPIEIQEIPSLVAEKVVISVTGSGLV